MIEKRIDADGEGADVDHSVAATDALASPGSRRRSRARREGGLGQRRDCLDRGVAEWMIGVGGLVGLMHGEQGEGARPDVDRVSARVERSASEPK